MLFNSIEFAVFFPIVATVFFLIPHRLRWLWLLLASCYFYICFIPIYIFVLFLAIIIDFWAAILIEKSEGHQKKKYLILSIVSTCLILFVFKYFNFFNDSAMRIAEFFHWNYSVKVINLLLPIGLSFHTFQSLSYVIEVYRGRYKAEKHFGIYALYVMFFPQLVAGPIERPQHLLPQFFTKKSFDYDRVVSGLRLMAWGFFKKIVIADRLAVVVNVVYNNPTHHTGTMLVIATFFFAYQIFCDF
jgi:alginate O-acetyltransferase complex protein AlgI